MKRLLPIAFVLTLPGCASTEAGSEKLTKDPPTGARLSPAGYVTIQEASPSPYPATPPPMPTQLDVLARATSLGTPEQQARAWALANGRDDFQDEVRRVMPLVTAEPNFVQARLVGDDGDKQLELFFTRDAEATLARHTTDPRFVARPGGQPIEELRQVMRAWFDRLEAAGIAPAGGSLDPIGGIVTVDTGIPRERFDDLSARNGWPDPSPDEVRFTFAAVQPPAFADPSLQPLVRVFARENGAPTIQLTALTIGTIILEDGCFRLKGGKRYDPGDLVMFGYGSQLDRDEQGYLVVVDQEAHKRYRIGERGTWGGPNGFSQNDPAVRALRRACGAGDIVNVRQPESERLFSLPYPLWVLDYAYSNDITYEAAWTEVTDCMARRERAGATGLEVRDGCIAQYNGWDYTGETMPPSPGRD